MPARRVRAWGVGLPFTFRSWQREQGLPQNFVRALAQTRDGYLWVGSDDGVTRFDGVRFVSFGLPEGLRSGPVRALFGDSRGALWIGSTGGGLTRWQDGRFTTYTMRNGLPTDSITALAEDGAGRLWVGTEAGLVLWQNGQPVPLNAVEEFKGKTITTLFKDSKGIMWLGATGAGVFYFQDGRFIQLNDASVGDLLQNPHCLLVGRDGRVWVGAGDDFVLYRDGDHWRPYRIPRHQARPYVSALAEGLDGTVWAGSVSEGLFQFKGGKVQALNAGSGLSDNLTESLLVDRDGALWVGTHGGLNQLRARNLFSFGPKEGLGYGAVQGLAEIAPGRHLGRQTKRWPLSLGRGKFQPAGRRGFIPWRSPGEHAAAGAGRQLLGGGRAWIVAFQRPGRGRERGGAVCAREIKRYLAGRGLRRRSLGRAPAKASFGGAGATGSRRPIIGSPTPSPPSSRIGMAGCGSARKAAGWIPSRAASARTGTRGTVC